MYARLFCGRTEGDQAEDFPTRCAELLLPGLAGKAGFKSLYIMQGVEGDKYVVLILWDGEVTADRSFEHIFQEQGPASAGLLPAPPSAETLKVVLRA